MSDSSPAGPVFPPFGPAFSRPAAASRPAAPAPPPQAAPDVPQAAAFGGGETRESVPAPAAAEEGLPWEMPASPEPAESAVAASGADASALAAMEADGEADADEGGDEAGEDLPWLEMPAGAPQSHAAELADPWATSESPAAPAAPWEQPETDAASPGQAWEPEADQPAAEAWETPAAADQPSAPDTSWMEWQDPQPPASAGTGMPSPAEPQPAAATQAEDIYFGTVHVEPAPGLVPVGDISGSEPEGTAPPFVAPAPSAEAVFVGQPAETEYAESTLAASEASAPPPTPAFAHGAPAAMDRHFGEVAARLERIARELRSDPQAFLAGGTGDPLDLLVTGFVLGASQRR